MCGYCDEDLALRIAEGKVVLGANPYPLAVRLALQEMPQLADAFAIGTPALRKGVVFTQIFLARLIDLLDRAGFESAEYRHLLRQQDFARLVDLGCDPTLRDDFDTQEPLLDTREFTWVRDRETYLTPGAFADSMGKVRRSAVLLRQYAQWWLGAGQREPDHPQLNNRAEDHRRQERSFLAMWATVIASTHQPEAFDTLRPIALNAPATIPGPHALDLWLQRRATLGLYDKEGIAPFIAVFGSLRAEIFRYLTLKRPITASERDDLRRHLRPGDLTTGESDEFSLRRWLAMG